MIVASSELVLGVAVIAYGLLILWHEIRITELEREYNQRSIDSNDLE